jgi:hypothetical protein
LHQKDVNGNTSVRLRLGMRRPWRVTLSLTASVASVATFAQMVRSCWTEPKSSPKQFRDMAPAVPSADWDALTTTINDAADCAGDGRVADGYRRLIEGLRRVEEARREGVPWADELACGYRQALDNYDRRYGSTQHGVQDIYPIPHWRGVRR